MAFSILLNQLLKNFLSFWNSILYGHKLLSIKDRFTPFSVQFSTMTSMDSKPLRMRTCQNPDFLEVWKS